MVKRWKISTEKWDFIIKNLAIGSLLSALSRKLNLFRNTGDEQLWTRNCRSLHVSFFLRQLIQISDNVITITTKIGYMKRIISPV